MSRTIVVIDYGMGNLRSVSKAVEHVCDSGDKVLVTDDPLKIANADRIIFPGQGAARDCMAAISSHHLNKALLEAARTKPFLGICMGLQVLMEFSEENDGTDLLGLLPGKVKRFAGGTDANGVLLKVPHMGWNKVHHAQQHPLWGGIDEASRFYFVHSYFVDPADKELISGVTDYGVPFASAIARDNLFATQFHPEKSSEPGLKLLRNFIEWSV